MIHEHDEPAGRASEPRGEVLSVEEIERRFPDEWVVVVEDDWDELQCDFTRGIVVAHDRDREAVRAVSRRLRSCAVFFTGRAQSPAPFHRCRSR